MPKTLALDPTPPLRLSAGSPPHSSGTTQGSESVLSYGHRRSGPLRPVVEELSQAPSNQVRRRSVGEARQQLLKSRPDTSRRFVERLARSGSNPLRNRDGGSESHPDEPAKPQPAGAVDGYRHDRHSGPESQVGRSVEEGQQLGFSGVYPPLSSDVDSPTAGNERLCAPRGCHQAALARSERNHGSAPPHYSIADLSLIHISEPTRLGMISYAVFCLK